MLAKITSTLDQVSNGRLTLGLGAGWQQSEYDAHGYAYPSNAERLAQMAEAIQVLKAMWTRQSPRFTASITQSRRRIIIRDPCNSPVRR